MAKHLLRLKFRVDCLRLAHITEISWEARHHEFYGSSCLFVWKIQTPDLLQQNEACTDQLLQSGTEIKNESYYYMASYSLSDEAGAQLWQNASQGRVVWFFL